jgi:hypothetical protein
VKDCVLGQISIRTFDRLSNWSQVNPILLKVVYYAQDNIVVRDGNTSILDIVSLKIPYIDTLLTKKYIFEH